MSQMEPERMLDPAPLARQYPTSRRVVDVDPVDPDELYTDGDPQAFAAAQRLAARQNESRVPVTTGVPGPDGVTAPPGFGPAQSVVTVGSLEQTRPDTRRRGWLRRKG